MSKSFSADEKTVFILKRINRSLPFLAIRCQLMLAEGTRPASLTTFKKVGKQSEDLVRIGRPNRFIPQDYDRFKASIKSISTDLGPVYPCRNLC